MLGGGIWVTQDEVLPGSYINIVSLERASSTLGERGIVAIPLALNKAPGTVIDLSIRNFVKYAEEYIGVKRDSYVAKPLREIFKHATRCLIYDLGTNGTAEQAVTALDQYEWNVLAVYTGTAADIATYIQAIKDWRDAGKKCQAVVYNQTSPDHEGIINVVSTVDGFEYENFDGDGTTVAFTVAAAPASVSAVLVNNVAKTASTDYSYSSTTHKVTFQTAPSDGDVIEVRYNNDVPYSLVAWLAGAEAGAEVNESCTNMIYDGELSVVTDKTQLQLEQCITSGQVAFHLVYGDVRVLEDINSLTTFTDSKGEDFHYNQTIRVIDQIANDIARLFNTKYLGKIPNDQSGRVSLWGDIVAHHRTLEEMRAIENFDSSLVTVEQGDTKKSVVVNDTITVVNAMAQLYMTLYIQ